MKRIAALCLILALLMGATGTTAFAAETDGTQMPSVTIGDDGTVTVNAEAPKYENGSASAYVYPEGKTTGAKDVELKWDSSQKAYVGKDSSIAGGQLAALHINYYEYIDNNKAQKYDRININTFYNGDKQHSMTMSLSRGVQRQFEYSYTDTDGKMKTQKMWVITDEIHERADIYYDKTGVKTQETVVSEEVRGDGKTYTAKSNREVQFFDSETGELNEIYTEESESSYEHYVAVSDGLADLDDREINSTVKTKYSYYNNEGEVTGSSDELTISSNVYTSDRKTRIQERNSNKYNKNGLKTGSSRSVLTQEYTGNNKTNTWEDASYKEGNYEYNRDGILTRSKIRSIVYGDESSDIYTESKYNAYTQQKTYEFTSQQRTDSKGNTFYTSETTYNNDDGTLRRRSTYDNDETKTYYNKDNKVVAVMDKDGTWKDGTGKVIGRNEYKDGDYQDTYVSFKSRTGEIDSYTIDTYISKDKTYEKKQYDGNGKLIYQSKSITKADGSYEHYENGKLIWTENGNEREYYDFKGNLSGSWKYNPETGEGTDYDYAGRKTRMEGDGYGEEYDKDGKVVRSWKTADGKTSYYDAKDQLLYSEGYDKDGAKVYYGKDGKEFARVYSTFEEKDDVNIWTRERIYGDEYGEGGYSEYWDPENNSGTMEKVVSKNESEEKDGFYTETYTYDYTKWDVVNGQKQNEVTRKEVSSTESDDEHYQSRTYKDDVLTYSYDVEKNEYGDSVKTTSRYYDLYTGKQTSAYKWIESGIPDDPMSYRKNYDKYDNLQTYAEIDDTDDWFWTKSYYANGNKAGESWEDQLDYDEEYSIRYYRNGVPSYEWEKKDENIKEAGYNRDGTYNYRRETVDGITNTINYDNHGTITGYKWNEKNEDGYYSYEYWDASKLIYTYTSENLADGWTETTADPDGNKLVWKNGEYTLTLVNNATSGWQNAVGEWFYLENGKPVKNDWRQLDGNWYYFNYEGAMVNGIKSEKTKDGNVRTYAISKDGTLSTGGWTEIYDGGWAYADQNGEVLTGWQQIDGNWYYFDDGWIFNKTEYKADANWSQSSWKGEMVTGAARIWNSDWTDKHTYFFNEDGTWDNSPGWKTAELNGEVEYHYYDENRSEVTGWKQIDGEWYYFNEDGVLKNGWVGNYFLDPAKDGAMATGWAQEVYEDWYYLNEDGTMKTGWLEDGGSWYYLKDSGAMASGEWITSGDSKYFMTESGTMASGWAKDKDDWYYLDPDSGAMATGWVQSGDSWYYMDPETGAMVSDGEVEVNGTTYKFDANGAWIP